MTLEFLSLDGRDRPILRFSGFTANEISELRNSLRGLIEGKFDKLRIHHLPAVSADCSLTLRILSWDQGIMPASQPLSFECGLCAETWDNIDGLLEPFSKDDVHGFQWLTELGEARLLVSVDGKW